MFVFPYLTSFFFDDDNNKYLLTYITSTYLDQYKLWICLLMIEGTRHSVYSLYNLQLSMACNNKEKLMKNIYLGAFLI